MNSPLLLIPTLVVIGSFATLRASPPDPAADPGLSAAITTQHAAFVDGVARGDAIAVAGLFTADAKLIVPGFDAIGGREAIRQAWQFVLGNGAVARIELDTTDLAGDDGGLVAETGTLVTFDKEGKRGARANYLLVWQRCEGGWRILRDIASPGAVPASVADRVGFPRDYRTAFRMLRAPRLGDATGMVQTCYGNETVADAKSRGQLPYPDGSILVLEFTTPRRDAAGKPLLDADGNPQRGEVRRVDVMRHGRGFGEAYGPKRAGEWEFASYRVDGSLNLPLASMDSCAECHRTQAGPGRDFVFSLP